MKTFFVSSLIPLHLPTPNRFLDQAATTATPTLLVPRFTNPSTKTTISTALSKTQPWARQQDPYAHLQHHSLPLLHNRVLSLDPRSSLPQGVNCQFLSSSGSITSYPSLQFCSAPNFSVLAIKLCANSNHDGLRCLSVRISPTLVSLQGAFLTSLSACHSFSVPLAGSRQKWETGVSWHGSRLTLTFSSQLSPTHHQFHSPTIEGDFIKETLFNPPGHQPSTSTRESSHTN